MPTNALMPLGYVDDSTEQGGTFSMARLSDRELIRPGTPVLIRNEDSRSNATALLRGEVTETTGQTAAFIISDQHIDPDWPDYLDPKGAGNPVYLGIPGTYHPDFNRGFASVEEYQYLLELAEEHRQATGIEPRGASYVPARRRDQQDEDC